MIHLSRLRRSKLKIANLSLHTSHSAVCFQRYSNQYYDKHTKYIKFVQKKKHHPQPININYYSRMEIECLECLVVRNIACTTRPESLSLTKYVLKIRIRKTKAI